MNKPTLVILEGPNRAGKSTVFKALLRDSDYQLYVLDRFTGSHIVYDKLWKRRETPEEHRFSIERAMKEHFDPLVVYLYAPIGVLKSRDEEMKTHSCDSFDLIEKRVGDIEEICAHYEDYLSKTPLEYISIDTNRQSVEEIVASIKHHLDSKRMTNDF